MNLKPSPPAAAEPPPRPKKKAGAAKQTDPLLVCPILTLLPDRSPNSINIVDDSQPTYRDQRTLFYVLGCVSFRTFWTAFGITSVFR